MSHRSWSLHRYTQQIHSSARTYLQHERSRWLAKLCNYIPKLLLQQEMLPCEECVYSICSSEENQPLVCFMTFKQMTKLLSQETVKLCFLHIVIQNSNTKASSWATRVTLTIQIWSSYTDSGHKSEHLDECNGLSALLLSIFYKDKKLGIFMLPGAGRPIWSCWFQWPCPTDVFSSLCVPIREGRRVHPPCEPLLHPAPSWEHRAITDSAL